MNTLSGVHLGLRSPGRSRKGVVIYVPLLSEVVVVRPCNLDAKFLPHRRTNLQTKPFHDPSLPQSLRLSQPDQRDLITRMQTDFPDVLPEHNLDGRADLSIILSHANSEDAAGLFFSNSPAGCGLVLTHQEYMAGIDTSASPSDHTNAPVRQGF